MPTLQKTYKQYYNTEYKLIMPNDRLIVGIDPDVTASGYAYWMGNTLSCTRVSFTDLLKRLEHISKSSKSVLVRVSAGWLNPKASFHAAKNIGTASRIGVNVGRNHQVGISIVEWCEYLGIAVEQVKPTTKKWTPEMFKAATGIQVLKGEQELIDAAYLIL